MGMESSWPLELKLYMLKAQTVLSSEGRSIWAAALGFKRPESVYCPLGAIDSCVWKKALMWAARELGWSKALSCSLWPFP